jgi:hypothetical protein
MSRVYDSPEKVPNSVLADRLEVLSDAIVERMKGDDGKAMDREYTCRIPAEVDRDPDIVLQEAAERIRRLDK